MTLTLILLLFVAILVLSGIMILNLKRRRAAALLAKEQTNRRLDTEVAKAKAAEPAKVPAKSEAHFIPHSGEKVRYLTGNGHWLVARVVGFEYGQVRARAVYLRRRGCIFLKFTNELRLRPKRLWTEIASAA